MKAMVISGSRNPEGLTAQATDALIEGLVAGGMQAEHVFLPTKQIERCRQCDDAGWGICRSQGKCVIEDDFAGIFAGLAEADAVVFATPVYFGGMSESLRAFLDRMTRIFRHDSIKQSQAGKPAVSIGVAGGSGRGAPQCVFEIEGLLKFCTLDMVDMIPVKRQNLEMKKRVLRTTGQWLATCPSTEA